MQQTLETWLQAQSIDMWIIFVLVGCERARLYSKEKEWETQGKETKGGGKERFKKKVMVLYVVMIH